MTPQQFIANWQASQLSERSACQSHFNNLCELLNQPKPTEADPEGAWYTFERGVRTSSDGQGFADVWMRGKFAWEYKGKRKNLKAAYQQLLQYREALENPPLLVVCDLNRFEIHTNFTGTAKRVYEFDLDGLAEPQNLDVLRKLFTNPEALKPGQTAQGITEQASAQFGLLADGLRQRGVPADAAAHFLMKLIFCLFAEDIELLPSGLFSRILAAGKKDPRKLTPTLNTLFAAMSTGGLFGADEILYFNGGLFADDAVLDLQPKEIDILVGVSAYDWSSIEPSIFGTLFERSLDPNKRSQIGAHYTSREDIETLLNPVMLTPLRREWDAVRTEAEAQWEKVVATRRKASDKVSAKSSPAEKKFQRLLLDFDDRLSHVTVLDPACGSGNFLYVALHMLLGLEKAVLAYAAKRGLPMLPRVLPTQLAGLEINPYAAELAQVAIWIGYLQWMRDNGFSPPSNPVLEPIESIKCQDAILDLTDPANPLEPEWPPAEFIVGNPPFLGGKLLRRGLGNDYVNALFSLYESRVKRNGDLCCYWFEKAAAQLSSTTLQRVGLLATQGIRGKDNRYTLDRMLDTGSIFFAVSDQEWTLNGAMVHVAMIGFDNGTETSRTLDAAQVTHITSSLTSGDDVGTAVRLTGNANLAFQGVTPMGPFEIPESMALRFLSAPTNVNSRPNSDVVRQWANGKDLLDRRLDQWIVDFGCDGDEMTAGQYQLPFEHTRDKVLDKRRKGRTTEALATYWLHWRPRPEMRHAISMLKSYRYAVTPRVGKHRIIMWVATDWLPSDATVAFAFEDDYDFGILHSRVHEVWVRAPGNGTQLRERESGFRYTPTTCFETFCFPSRDETHRRTIAAAAKDLDRLRSNWLNPPEMTRTEVLEFPGCTDGPWARYLDPATLKPLPDGSAQIGTVRYPRLVPKDADAEKVLKKRTLTNLYNQRPTWLQHAHEKLDAAVFAAYGWDPNISDEELLAKLLELNLASA